MDISGEHVLRKLIWLIVILAALYGGYWFVGSHLLQGQLDKWVAEERAAGRQADFGVLKVQGFPSRFDIRAENIALYNPQTGMGWTAPEAELAALAYQPQHYIAVLPQTQVIRAPGADIGITSQDMRASLVFSPGPSFVLDRMSFVSKGLAVEPGAPELRTGAADLRIATQRAAGTDYGHRLGFEALGLIVPEFILEQLRSAPTELPATMDRVHLDAVVDFDRRLDRHVLNGPRPEISKIKLEDLSLSWGPIGFAVTGDVTVLADGTLTGPIELSIRGMTQLFDIATAAGLLPAERRRMVEGMLSMVAKPDASGTAKLSFEAKNGTLHLGPLALTALPKLRLN